MCRNYKYKHKISTGHNVFANESNSMIYLPDLFYFISIFILLTCRKATEALIHRVSNYANLLLEMKKYCCPLEINEIAKTTKQGKVP